MRSDNAAAVILVAAAAYLAWVILVAGCGTWGDWTWARTTGRPIEVVIDPSVGDCWRSATVEAVTGINAAVRGELWRVRVAESRAAVPLVNQILIVEGTLGTMQCHEGMTCERAGVAGPTTLVGRRIWSAKVTLSRRYCSAKTAAHELGHALGLGHRQGGTIMTQGPAANRWHRDDVAHMRKSL